MYDRLRAEARGAFASEDAINLAAVERLPYLNACLEEGLRVFSPAPIGFLRKVQDGGDVIDGEAIPGGVSDFGGYNLCRYSNTDASYLEDLCVC